ncbi:MAG: M23 family metallopeptidase [Idiomarina sp.]|nr:M23 family metallopeptidase [Idiomarina sp.]
MLSLCVLLSGVSSAQADMSIPEPSLRGNFVQGGMVIGRTTPGATVEFNGDTIQVGRHGDFVFGIGRDDEGPVQLRVRYANGQVWEESFPIESRKFDIQRVDGLPQQTVTPDPEVQRQIRANNEEVWHARQVRSERTDFTTQFIWPAEGRITGVYGSQRILNGQPRAPHWGLDIAAPTGSPVYAPADGIVTLTHPDMVLSGGTLIVDHGHGVFSTFIHLHAIHVEVGQEVKQGELIAEIGATGRATGPHLDWRINWGQVRVDPQLLVPPRD